MKKAILGLISLLAVIVLFVFFLTQWPDEKETEKEPPIRPPAVAGTFYPADEKVLSSQVEGFLDKTATAEKRPSILIVPHAGYRYSGQVAAFGFNQFLGSGVKRVIILGNTHKIPFSGAAVDDQGFWQTPLGRVEIDTDLASKIITASPQIFANQEYHQEEHSLEVEVPFLQKVLTDFKIVPILIGGRR
jgi:AmmeMemoRadiSam system protein B